MALITSLVNRWNLSEDIFLKAIERAVEQARAFERQLLKDPKAMTRINAAPPAKEKSDESTGSVP